MSESLQNILPLLFAIGLLSLLLCLPLYLMAHALILWITIKWKDRNLYQKIVSIVGPFLLIFIPLGLYLLTIVGLDLN